ncbi:cysteine dioxygenase type 1 isoform X2 [Pelodiscus sinensis]|uniref:cysteine dioxygenase type 1 isoform X2 n=1 Tax=Pelodiscus sinensis TaxID=13735 RepID=UPI0007040EF1|nr:cysteine dioxygenase type 1 isoform X2 [Pelodiscus sinensis]|eukprot:XP_025046171.1 cysteine dioxygenase type 1 isoform X2 [Pelodiscus sinensis]
MAENTFCRRGAAVIPFASGFAVAPELRAAGSQPAVDREKERLLSSQRPAHGASSIHDHTDSHCFMKILQGNLKETLFEWPGKKGTGAMTKKSERVLGENQCAYIHDSIGLHRVENTSHTESAVSLHLYSPAFDNCNTFDQRTGHKHKVKMTFYSQFGERTPGATAVSQENN